VRLVNYMRRCRIALLFGRISAIQLLYNRHRGVLLILIVTIEYDLSLFNNFYFKFRKTRTLDPMNLRDIKKKSETRASLVTKLIGRNEWFKY
jgi:hypothetical protein